MSQIGQKERVTQNRVVEFFQTELGYSYLGDWHDRDNKNIETSILVPWLKRQGISDTLINKVLRRLDQTTALGGGRYLYDANLEFYNLLRYGVKEKQEAGEQNQTIWLIDWQNIDNNEFAIAEEVTVQGQCKKRPDIVLYINGIALGVLELKRSSVEIGKGIRQNLDNQKELFIQQFFTTMQLVMAGSDSVGIYYGTIETPEKYYLKWKEPLDQSSYTNLLDNHLHQLCRKERLLELLHDFIVFDHGAKKTCRHNQYFGVKAAQQYIAKREGGIIWHTQGSGKSLSMVWLAKWIREHIKDSRVVIITDRTELDEQIENVFKGVREDIYRTKSGTDLITRLNTSEEWLICSLIHKFGHQNEKEGEKATEEFIAELQKNITKDFRAKGDIFVFVDECHRTQSGKLHDAMKSFLPSALFIGFTGTPLLKADKKKSLEVFGPYIHTYKFDEAVADGVVLDLRYEARDIDQFINSPERVDQWFESKTSNLTRYAKTELKRKWGTLQKLHSSEPRLRQIVHDIVLDMELRPRLKDRRGNALLVCSSVYQACTIFKLLQDTELEGHCAIVTSYKPTPNSIKEEETGEGKNEALLKYDVYRKMLAKHFDEPENEAANKVERFEQEVKQRFIKQPAQMRLLIVVDKLLTGFDAPPATYLYIDKQMQDHALFQAICRVNRLDGDDKDYGYIIDYRDLFKSLKAAIKDYTSDAFAHYDKADIEGLLKDRLIEAKKDLDDALEAIRGLCEVVPAPRAQQDYIHYFTGISGENNEALTDKEPLRITLYKQVSKVIRAYINIANEMGEAGYTAEQIKTIREEVEQYRQLKLEIQQASGDYLDMKSIEPAMRRLLDMYISADQSEEVAKFEDLGLIELIVNQGLDGVDTVLKGMGGNQEAMSEAIENNIRKKIVDENPVNPKYYEKMSVLLDELIELRRKNAIEYKKYLEEIIVLAKQTVKPEEQEDCNYPDSIDTLAKRAFYDNLGKDEALANRLDEAIRNSKKADWLGHMQKERKIKQVIDQALEGTNYSVEEVFELVKMQREYH
ncbi:type I restriction endonuclease subunit R [Neisseria sp. Ec49-e6-T10]|uniref:type I restriction endonuclease subunit R n=1 Tax=Neisseria sp. Ec49-e6-T10 TaxID=3140744 RepID=UPI003EBB4E03